MRSPVARSSLSPAIKLSALRGLDGPGFSEALPLTIAIYKKRTCVCFTSGSATATSTTFVLVEIYVERNFLSIADGNVGASHEPKRSA